MAVTSVICCSVFEHREWIIFWSEQYDNIAYQQLFRMHYASLLIILMIEEVMASIDVTPCIFEGHLSTSRNWFGYLANVSVVHSGRMLFEFSYPADRCCINVLFYNSQQVSLNHQTWFAFKITFKSIRIFLHILWCCILCLTMLLEPWAGVTAVWQQ